jgi:putative phage-type endonuclease
VWVFEQACNGEEMNITSMKRSIEQLIREKQTGLGSSDAAAIMGLSRFKTALHVRTEKLEKISVQEETDVMRLGLLFEPVILQLYHARTGRKPRRVNVVVRSKEHPFMLAHLDAKTGSKPIEAKLALFPRGDFGEEETDEIPTEYVIQTQHQMAVTGAVEVDVPVLMFGKLRLYIVKRNERLISRIIEEELDFWNRYIVGNEELSPDFNHPATPELLKGLHRLSSGKSIDLEAAIESIAGLYEELGKKESEVKGTRAQLKAQLLHAMGDAEIGLTPNGMLLKRKEIHRDGYSVKPTDFVNLYIKRIKEKVYYE